MKKKNKTIVGLRELRENTASILKQIKRGESVLVFRRSQPLFKISPIKESRWEEVIDFTKIKNGGVDIDDVLSRL